MVAEHSLDIRQPTIRVDALSMATESYTAAVDPIRNLLLGLVAGQQCMPPSSVVMSILPTYKGQFSRAFQIHHAISRVIKRMDTKRKQLTREHSR